MTDQASTADRPPSSESVRRSLRALADGSAPGRDRTTVSGRDRTRDGIERAVGDAADVETLVGDAAAATECAREAGTFLADGRLAELDDAITTATRRDACDLARRGRRARRCLRRLADALTAENRLADTPAAEDHFRSGRGTVLGRSGQRPDR